MLGLDFKDVLALVTLVLGTIGGVAFGRNGLRRDSNATKGEIDSAARYNKEIERLNKEIDRLERRNETLLNREEAALQDCQNLRNQMTSKDLAASAEVVERLQKQVSKALEAVEPERLNELFKASGFHPDVQLRPPPPVPKPPTESKPPVEGFRWNEPYA